MLLNVIFQDEIECIQIFVMYSESGYKFLIRIFESEQRTIEQIHRICVGYI